MGTWKVSMHIITRKKENLNEISIEEIKMIKGNEMLSDDQAELIRQDILKLCDFMASAIIQNNKP